MEPRADIALIGLAVMGQNLILNMNDRGFTVVAYNRTTSKVDEFLAHEAKGTNIIGAHSLVNRDLPDYSIAWGVPCRVVGRVEVSGADVSFIYSGTA